MAAPQKSPGASDRYGVDHDATEAMRALFLPERIAIIGATPRRGFANNIHQGILRQGFEGQIFGVTPRHEEVLGAPCYPRIDQIPGGVDKAIVVVPSHVVPDVLEQCPAAGVKAVNIITSGFGEQSDEEAARRQDYIRDFARRTGIRVVGPNCLGLVSTPGKMIAKSGPYTTVQPGPVGLVFQSGLLTYGMILPPEERGIGYSYVVTTGNEADLEAADFIKYFVEDDATQIIACFIEQFRSPEKLRHVAKMAMEKGKPLIVLKIGRSEGGQRAARAHTGSLVGSDEIADATMRQLGIIRVRTLDEMTETIAAFHSKRLPKGNGVGTIFISGGAGGLVSDLSQDIGLNLPELSPETVEKLKPVIPEYGTIGNPLDTTGQAATQPEITEGSLVSIAEDPNIDVVIYGQAYPTMIDYDTPVGQVLKSMPDRFPDKVFLIMSLVSGKLHDGFRFGDPPVDPVNNWDGTPFLQGADDSLKAVRSMIDYAEFRRQWLNGYHPASAKSDLAGTVIESIRAAAGEPLTERAAKELLSIYDIPVTRELLATTADEAVQHAECIGYPVVLKIESPDILHKTDSGGLALDLRTPDDVRAAFDRIISRVNAYDSNARVNGILVQAMARPGREIILGMSQDPDFGPAIAVGLGGIFVEVLDDVQLGVPPIDERTANQMLSRLRGSSILDGGGARGTGPSDRDELVRILGRFSQLCVDLADDVTEIDINPLLLYGAGEGACVVDCLIVPRNDTDQ
ncbi:MAG: acetate--CoA ligase family protein [Thermomicrobiaceae bacterium]